MLANNFQGITVSANIEATIHLSPNLELRNFRVNLDENRNNGQSASGRLVYKPNASTGNRNTVTFRCEVCAKTPSVFLQKLFIALSCVGQIME